MSRPLRRATAQTTTQKMSVREFDQLNTFESFRDPAGKVVLTDHNVWRLVRAEKVAGLRELLDLKAIEKWRQEGMIVDTERAATDDIERLRRQLNGSARFDFAVFKHNRIYFPSFPCEWSPSMLYDAAKFTIEMAETLLATGWGIKDASPFNILFNGTKPVFVDILSFEKRDPKDPIWLAYNQFVSSFVVPLLLNRELSISLDRIFLTNRDGMPISEAARLLSGVRRFKPRIFSIVTVPEFLSRRVRDNQELYKPKKLNSAEAANFVLRRNFRRLRKQLERSAPNSFQESNWTDYTDHNRATSPEYMSGKQDFVTSVLNESRPKSVLDIGCNTGFFTFLAAKSGSKVVAIDSDEAVVDRVYLAAKTQGLDILPLVVNVSRPTPRSGWRYSENPSFLDRALGRSELVLMLAVVHHMLVQERVPLREIFRLAADLTNDSLVIEYVPPDDRMFLSLTRGRDHLHRDLTERSFVESASEFFDIVRSEQLPNTGRRIYLMRRRK